MLLSDHIQTLLREHDCVIIPEFGGLIAEYAPARVHPVRHTLTPPAKHVAFNQSLTRNDGLLVDALSRARQVSKAQARELVRDAVARLRAELETQQRAELRGIGIFRQAPGRGLDFEYTGLQNLLPASYGLPELVSRPVRATDALLARDRQPTAPLLAVGRRARRLWQTSAVVALVGVVAGFSYLLAGQWHLLPDSLRPRQPATTTFAPVGATSPVAITRQQAALARSSSEEWPAEAELVAESPAPVAADSAVVVPATPVAAAETPIVVKPVPTVKAVATAAAKPVAPVATSSAKPAGEAAAAEGTIKTRTGRFYAIAGVFNTLRTAQRSVQILHQRGQDAQIILPSVSSRYYRIAVGNFADKAAAYNHMPQLRKQFGPSLWVLNY